jgi:hypothetical protein
VFTAGEQQFFAEKGFTPPNRCKPCRAKRKAEREAGGDADRNNGPREPVREYRGARRPASEPILEYRTRAPQFEPQADFGGGRDNNRRRKKGRRKRRNDEFGVDW